LYARFITKALADAGEIDFREPFSSLRHQGMVLAEDGTKMSKSKGNVVNPNDVVDRLGADTLRMYELFAGPFSESFDWDTDSIAGPRRFIERVWRLVHEHEPKLRPVCEPPESAMYMHQTVKKVTSDIAEFKFNTAISALMEARNTMHGKDNVADDSLSVFLRLLAPFAPHVSEELWNEFGPGESIHKQDWPEFSPQAVEAESVAMAVQVDGTLRGQVTVDKNAEKADIIERAKADNNVANNLENKTVTRTIFVSGELVNFVTE
jgi:leucyl-tRNA synthetase